MRALAGLRSFGRYLEREGRGKVGALSAIRAPKVAKCLPKPIQMDAAKRFADADEVLVRVAWSIRGIGLDVSGEG
jgi:integrase/recombinase XerC